MFKNYFKTAWRNIRKNKLFSTINILGLSIGIATCFIIMLYVQDELSYDRFNKKAGRTYRVAFKANINGGKILEGNVMPPVAAVLKKDYPEVEEATRLNLNGDTKITYNNKTFKESKLAIVDSNFFSVFTLPFIKGNSKTALMEPHNIVLTKDMAHKYFNTEEPIGKLDDEQIKDYLHLLQKQHNTPSDSYFKHTVYGLRFVFRLEGLKDNAVKLPSIKHEKKLPIILSREEVKQLLKAPSLLKHRVLLALLYGCGLRLSEVRNIRLKDIDFNRDKLHIRQSKGKKDRYVPLGKNLIRGLTKYIDAEQPQQWLFNGQPNEQNNGNETGYSQRGIQWVVRKAVRASGIIKEVNAHTLRHTYATHLLEDGLDIVTIKDLLGHECIETTMIYLHVAQPGRRPPFSPFDTLYNNK